MLCIYLYIYICCVYIYIYIYAVYIFLYRYIYIYAVYICIYIYLSFMANSLISLTGLMKWYLRNKEASVNQSVSWGASSLVTSFPVLCGQTAPLSRGAEEQWVLWLLVLFPAGLQELGPRMAAAHIWARVRGKPLSEGKV